MATNFPGSLDTLTNPTSGDALNSPDHAGQHSDANDAVEALQAKVGVDSSVVTSSHDYKINQLETNNTGTNTGDETTTSVGSLVSGATAKTTPVDADNVAITDSAATHILKKVTWANIKATLKTYFDTLYAAALGADDNYVTDAEKIVIGNTSGTNTGDQTLPVKATGTEIDTGTDDAKFATPKAIADSALISNVVEDTTPQLGGTLDTNSKQVRWSKGADVASGTALTLGDDGNYFDITGTTTITSIGTKAIGTVVKLHFDGVLTLTHHATDLILPGGANITTAAGDEAEFVEYATGDWRCTSYTKASGEAVVSGGSTYNFTTHIEGYNAARWTVSSQTNAAFADNVDGLRLYTGDQAHARALASLDLGNYSYVFKYSPRVEILLELGTISPTNNQCEMFIGFGDFANTWSADSEILWNSYNHIGFRIEKGGGSTKLQARTGNGTNSSTTQLYSGLQNNNTLRLIFEYDGTTASFYYSLNGGSLSSATEITTYVPSVSADVDRFQMIGTKWQNSSTSNGMEMFLKSATIYRTLT